MQLLINLHWLGRFKALEILKYRHKNIRPGTGKILISESSISDKDAVEKRLFVLQQQGYIYST